MEFHDASVRVRYAETDQMGVVYHANYLIWFEIGRVELMRALQRVTTNCFAYAHAFRRPAIVSCAILTNSCAILTIISSLLARLRT